MTGPRFFLHLNSLLFRADRSHQRIAFGLVVACLLIGGSLSALHSSALLVVVLLLPRRAA
jgi:hypothetical protein